MNGTPSASRVLIRPPNWLGDAVMALPALSAVRRHFASSHLTIAAVPAVAALFREDIDAAPDRVIELPAGHRAAVALFEGEGFDTALLLPNSFRSAWQIWRAGIPQRWGIARSGRRLLLTRAVSLPVRPGVRHQADYYRDLVNALGIACGPDEPPRVRPRSPSIERARSVLDQHRIARGTRLVGLAPGAAYGQAKQWPPDRVAAVAAELVRRHDATCLVVGASHDRDASVAIDAWLRTHASETESRVVNLAGRTSLGALVALMAEMEVFLSNDSGAMHLAAAVGRPVVAIFGPTDERATRPIGDHVVIAAPVFCRPCLLRDCPIDHRCMKRISVETVYAAVASRLGSTASS